MASESMPWNSVRVLLARLKIEIECGKDVLRPTYPVKQWRRRVSIHKLSRPYSSERFRRPTLVSHDSQE